MLHTNRMKRSMVLVQYIQLRVSEDRLFQSKETRSSAFHTHIHKCKIQSVCVCGFIPAFPWKKPHNL